MIPYSCRIELQLSLLICKTTAGVRGPSTGAGESGSEEPSWVSNSQFMIRSV